MLSRLILSFLTLIFALSSIARAEDKLYFDGFVGVGLIHESANNFISNTNDTHEMVEIALRGSYEYNDNLTFTGQVGFRRFGEFANDNGARVDYAQINYTTSLFANSEQMFSIGRVKNQLGLYNLARDITLSRPSILLPQSAYIEYWRNLFLSTNGASLSSNFYINKGTLSATITAGQIKIDNNFNKVMLGRFAQGKWVERDNLIADIRYVNDILKLGVSYHTIDPSYNASPSDQIPLVPIGNYVQGVDGNIKMESYFVFAQATLKDFEFSAEYSFRDVAIKGFTAFQSLDRSMEGYYIQGKYSTSPTSTLTVRYEEHFRLAKYKSGIVTPLFTFPAHYNNAKTISLSGSYNFSKRWTLMADLHFVEGSGFLAPFATPTFESIERKHWALSAVQLIYSF